MPGKEVATAPIEGVCRGYILRRFARPHAEPRQASMTARGISTENSSETEMALEGRQEGFAISR